MRLLPRVAADLPGMSRWRVAPPVPMALLGSRGGMAAGEGESFLPCTETSPSCDESSVSVLEEPRESLVSLWPGGSGHWPGSEWPHSRHVRGFRLRAGCYSRLLRLQGTRISVCCFMPVWSYFPSDFSGMAAPS